MADMAMDGALSGEEETKENIKRISSRVGTGQGAAIEDGREIMIPKKTARQIMASAIAEGNRWVDDIEEQVRKVYRNALAAKEQGTEIERTKILAQVSDAILAQVEPTGKAAAFALPTPAKKLPKKVPAIKTKSKATYRKRQTVKRWSPEMKRVLTDKERKILKAQAIARMRTGWNRWYNNRVVARVQDNPEVIYLQFTLGRAKNHTDICTVRQGMVLPKNDPKWATNTPPLHYNCRSTLIPVTRGAAKKWGIKRYTPREIRDDDYSPQVGFVLT